MKTIQFVLAVKAPFSLGLTVWALKRRSDNAIDDWDGKKYTRILVFENLPVKVEISHDRGRNRILVLAKSEHAVLQIEAKLTAILNSMFGLKIDLEEFYRLSEGDKALRPLVHRFKGMKPPRFPTLFETLTNAIAFQQLSLESGFSLLNKLINRYGMVFKDKTRTFHAFPQPERIMKCKIEDLKALGFSRRKSESLIAAASQMQQQKIGFQTIESLSDEEIIGFICSFKGFGRWSGEYALLRGFGRINILPGDDVGIHKSLKILLNLRKEVGYEKVKQMEQKWYPYAGIVYFYILLHKLEGKGILPKRTDI